MTYLARRFPARRASSRLSAPLVAYAVAVLAPAVSRLLRLRLGPQLEELTIDQLRRQAAADGTA